VVSRRMPITTGGALNHGPTTPSRPRDPQSTNFLRFRSGGDSSPPSGAEIIEHAPNVGGRRGLRKPGIITNTTLFSRSEQPLALQPSGLSSCSSWCRGFSLVVLDRFTFWLFYSMIPDAITRVIRAI